MLATVKQIRTWVRSHADMRSAGGLYRREWANRSQRPGLVNMAFRFWDPEKAEQVASGLREYLAAGGYSNPVRVTSVAEDREGRTAGGEYVRVLASRE